MEKDEQVYTGHGLSQKDVAELVLLCANCEKNRREKEDKLVPIV